MFIIIMIYNTKYTYLSHPYTTMYRTLLSSIDIYIHTDTYSGYGFNYENMWKLHKYCDPFIVNLYFYYNIALFINDMAIINHATNIIHDEVSRNPQLRQAECLLRAWTYTFIVKLV